MIGRRGFLGGLSAILASGFAPAAVGSDVLMPVRSIILPETLIEPAWTPIGRVVFVHHGGTWPGSYPTLAAALAAVTAGDSVHVLPGHNEWEAPKIRHDIPSKEGVDITIEGCKFGLLSPSPDTFPLRVTKRWRRVGQ